MATDILNSYVTYPDYGYPSSRAGPLSTTRRSTYSYPESQQAYNATSSGTVVGGPFSRYSRHGPVPSHVGSRISAAKTESRVNNRKGYVPDMPASDYFTSGDAHRDGRKLRLAAKAYNSPVPSQVVDARYRPASEAPSRVESQYSRGRTRTRDFEREYDAGYDACSVVPEDSISQVSTVRTHRSTHQKKAMIPSQRTDSVIGGEDVKSVRTHRSTNKKKSVVHSQRRDSVIEEEDEDDEGQWAEDERRYFDKDNARWQRNVRPNYTRGYA